ncbi:MAG TPA: glycosyltransferase family 87 protein [Solirubrobacteraceae bacterium]|jgi:hypothetical membrane protein
MAEITMADLIVAIATAVGLALRLYQLARPGLLFGSPQYDDGVDFGSAVALVHGYLPYRDFAFVQPPGISLLMAPVAVLAKITSTDTGFAVARLITACAGAASVTLVGLLVRHRGTLAVTLACAIAALHPDAILAASTVFLEPWLVLFCLLGAVAVFDRDRVTASRRRLAAGGFMLGLAAVVKVWAVFPALVLLVLLATERRWRRAATYAAGVVGGFCVPVAPFAAQAPKAFFDSVITAQLSRIDVSRVPVPTRLISLFGLDKLSLGEPEVIAATGAIVGGIVVCSVVGALFRGRRPPAIEQFALATAALVLAAFMWPDDYYTHYAGFFAAFFALSIGLAAGSLVRGWGLTSASPRQRPRATQPAALVAIVAVIVGMVVHDLRDESARSAPGPAVAVERRIPQRACVLTDDPSLTLAADRFVSDAPGCAPTVDPVGTNYALANGRNGLTGAGRVRAVQAAWLSALRRAAYVWLTCGPPRAAVCQLMNRRIPWTAPIFAYFVAHFRRGTVSAFLYVRHAR